MLICGGGFTGAAVNNGGFGLKIGGVGTAPSPGAPSAGGNFGSGGTCRAVVVCFGSGAGGPVRIASFGTLIGGSAGGSGGNIGCVRPTWRIPSSTFGGTAASLRTGNDMPAGRLVSAR